METSLLVARIMAAAYLSIGLGILINTKYYEAMLGQILRSGGYLLIGGWIALGLGVVLVQFHNIWTNDWTILVTIVGWIALIKGMALLIFPNWTQFYGPFLSGSSLKWIGIFALILGLTFGYFGFV